MTEATQHYELLRGSHTRWEGESLVRYRAGDHLALSAKQAASAAFQDVRGSRLRAVEAPAKPPQPPADRGAGGGQPSIASLHWTRAAAAIRAADDPQRIDEMIAAERAGKARKGVLKAAERRLEELAVEETD